MTFEERYNLVFESLAEEGYRPKKWDEKEISFKAEGSTLYVRLDEQDEDFFQVFLVLGNIGQSERYTKCLEAINRINCDVKVGKIFTLLNDEEQKEIVYCVTEAFVDNWETWIDKHLLRCISTVQHMAKQLDQKMATIIEEEKEQLQ